MRTAVVCALVALCVAAQVEAGVVIPVSATASNEIGPPHDRKAEYTRDLSGLTGDRHGTSPNGTMWLTTNSPSTTSATMVYDLGASYTINGFHLWNYNETGNFTNRGAHNVLVSTSADNVTYSTPQPMVFQKASGLGTYVGEDYPIGKADAQYVKFDVQGNFGGPLSDTVGLSEIRFTTPSVAVGDYVRPVAAAASSEIGAPFDRKAVHTIDGSGLDASSQHGTTPDGYMWLNDYSTTGWIGFDLGAVTALSGFQLWNYNEAGNFTNRGMQSADVIVSLDGVTGTSLGNFSFAKAPGTATYAGDDYSLAEPVLARYVLFDNAVNFGGPSSDTLGLSEIRFATPTLISGVTAIASSAYTPGGRVGSKLLDGSGMSGFASEWADDDPANMWLADRGNIVGQTVTFDLCGEYELRAARVWNYNEAGGSTPFINRGVELMDIALSLDGLDFFTLEGPVGGHFYLNQAPGTDNYIDADMLDLGGGWARYVRFTVVDYYGTTPGSDYVGLSEVRFYGTVPEPATLSLLALGGLGLLRRRRRR